MILSEFYGTFFDIIMIITKFENNVQDTLDDSQEMKGSEILKGISLASSTSYGLF